MKLNRTNALAALWGLAEATLFFIVPDVFLSWIALRSFKRAMWACLWALLGALIGGAFIWYMGLVNADPLRAVFTSIPAVNEGMMNNVRDQLQNSGLVALFIGPLVGTPYKLYALEAAQLGYGLFIFLLISIPARLMRFIIVTVVSAAASRALNRIVGIRTLQILHVCVWVAFYSWYFHVMSSSG
jgi:membrane protein YqaA with SNARE-associated domain